MSAAPMIDAVLAASSREELAQVLAEVGVTPTEALEAIRNTRASVVSLTDHLERTKDATATATTSAKQPRSFSSVKNTICKYWPGHWPLVEAELAAVATILLKDVGQSLALFVVGPSSAGKSTTLYMFGIPEREALVYAQAKIEPPVEQLDNFTLPSFLSHFSEKKSAVLEQEALAYRLRHRVLLTPELARMFRGRRERLDEMFGELAHILDGEGSRTASGVHGTHGLKGNFPFVWLGGTTPFRMETWKTMAQLGTRLLFFRVSDDAATMPDEEYFRAREECRETVFDFCATLLSPERRRQSPWPTSSDSIRRELRGLANLLAAGQGQPGSAEDEPIRPGPNHFRMRLTLLVSGRALLHGRDALCEEDLELARHIVRSSMPGSRGPVLVTLYDCGPQSAGQLAAATGLTDQYVLKTLKALEAVDVVTEAGGKWSLREPEETGA
jgi:hypothetical protein